MRNLNFSEYNPLRSLFIYNIYNAFKESLAWLFPEKITYPDNATGQLMRQTLTHKSWFDAISSYWVERPIWNKGIIFASILLLSSFVGFLAGASLIFLFSSLHMLLVSHEHQRVERAKALVSTSMILNNELDSQLDALENGVKGVYSATHGLGCQTEQISNETDRLNAATQVLHEQKEKLVEQLDKTAQSASSATAQSKEVVSTLQNAGAHLRSLDDSIIGAEESVQNMSCSIDEFSVTINGIQKSQIAYSEAVTRLGAFFDKQRQPKREKEEYSSSSFMEELDAALTEFEAEKSRIMSDRRP